MPRHRQVADQFEGGEWGQSDVIRQVPGQGAAGQSGPAIDDHAATAADTGAAHEVELQGGILFLADFAEGDEQGHGVRFLDLESLQPRLAVRVTGIVRQYL